MKRHYLDHNATAPVRPEVIEAVASAMSMDGNALSVHEEGRRAHKIVEDAREEIRSLINAPVNGVVFTSSGTESIHNVLHGAVKAHGLKRIYISAIEHPAVAANAETTGAEIELLPVTSAGVIDLDLLRTRLRRHQAEAGGPFLVCLMFANNETGVIQPVAEAAAIVHEYDGLLFCDAAQAVGKVPVNFVMSGADIMSFYRSQIRRSAWRRRSDCRTKPAARSGVARRRPGNEPPRQHHKHAGHCRIGKGVRIGKGKSCAG